MQTVTIRLTDGILKVVDIPVDTKVVLEDTNAGIKTTYKKEENGRMWKEHGKIKEVEDERPRLLGINR